MTLTTSHDRVLLPNPSRPSPQQVLYRDAALPLARTADGTWLTWTPSHDGHLFVGGYTGAGATSTLRTVLTSWTALGWACFILDANHRLQPMRDWPNVQTYVDASSDGGASQALLNALRLELQRRMNLIDSGTARPDDLDPILLIIHDVSTLKAAFRRLTRDHGSARGESHELDVLGRWGRAVRIHLAVSSHSVRFEALSGDELESFTQRMWLGRSDHCSSYRLWDSIIGAELGTHTPGRCIIGNYHRLPVKAQAAWTPDPRADDDEARALLAALRPTQTQRAPLQLAPSEEGRTTADTVTRRRHP